MGFVEARTGRWMTDYERFKDGSGREWVSKNVILGDSDWYYTSENGGGFFNKLGAAVRLLTDPRFGFPIPQPISIQYKLQYELLECKVTMPWIVGASLSNGHASSQTVCAGVKSVLDSSLEIAQQTRKDNEEDLLFLPDLLGGYTHPKKSLQNCVVDAYGRVWFVDVYPIIEVKLNFWSKLRRLEFTEILKRAFEPFGHSASLAAKQLAGFINKA